MRKYWNAKELLIETLRNTLNSNVNCISAVQLTKLENGLLKLLNKIDKIY